MGRPGRPGPGRGDGGGGRGLGHGGGRLRRRGAGGPGMPVGDPRPGWGDAHPERRCLRPGGCRADHLGAGTRPCPPRRDRPGRRRLRFRVPDQRLQAQPPAGARGRDRPVRGAERPVPAGQGSSVNPCALPGARSCAGCPRGRPGAAGRRPFRGPGPAPGQGDGAGPGRSGHPERRLVLPQPRPRPRAACRRRTRGARRGRSRHTRPVLPGRRRPGEGVGRLAHRARPASGRATRPRGPRPARPGHGSRPSTRWPWSTRARRPPPACWRWPGKSGRASGRCSGWSWPASRCWSAPGSEPLPGRTLPGQPPFTLWISPPDADSPVSRRSRSGSPSPGR